MNVYKRLEELSDKMRHGIPVDIADACEVIEYQLRLNAERNEKRSKTVLGRLLNFFKPNKGITQ